MVEAVGSVAARLDAWIVAEGVEVADELHCLLRLGVPLAQGWLLGKPQAGWSAVPPSAVAVIKDYRRRASDVTDVAALLESWPSVVLDDAPDTATAGLTLLLDGQQRPVAWRGPALGGLQTERPLVVKLATPLRAAARRAMARNDASRFLPVVCTDDEGRYLGVIRIEQIVERLAR
jgi:hypothetical protein